MSEMKELIEIQKEMLAKQIEAFTDMNRELRAMKVQLHNLNGGE